MVNNGTIVEEEKYRKIKISSSSSSPSLLVNVESLSLLSKRQIDKNNTAVGHLNPTLHDNDRGGTPYAHLSLRNYFDRPTINPLGAKLRNLAI